MITSNKDNNVRFERCKSTSTLYTFCKVASSSARRGVYARAPQCESSQPTAPTGRGEANHPERRRVVARFWSKKSSGRGAQQKGDAGLST